MLSSKTSSCRFQSRPEEHENKKTNKPGLCYRETKGAKSGFSIQFTDILFLLGLAWSALCTEPVVVATSRAGTEIIYSMTHT